MGKGKGRFADFAGTQFSNEARNALENLLAMQQKSTRVREELLWRRSRP